jgi:hypothetical protein
VQIPVLEYKTEGKKLLYRWTDCVDGFNLPLKISFDTSANSFKWIFPVQNKWKKLSLSSKDLAGVFSIDRNFYVKSKKAE